MKYKATDEVIIDRINGRIPIIENDLLQAYCDSIRAGYLNLLAKTNKRNSIPWQKSTYKKQM